ncbi:MAG TPA: SUMF1/EgtB/PvdO family nonheme iron enzyme [Pyrinomonadaceae bacterium]|nr:SUMF1/EgtB/PvdO family nonheme iron enzyme [Pyrinomonadaceae bacterium]
MRTEQAARIAEMLETTRAATLRLFDLAAREEDLHVSPGCGFRPIIWHLAHIGVFEAYWILQKVKGASAPDERYERIFDPISTPREQSKNLPTRREMEDYLSRVRSATLQFLEDAPMDESAPSPLQRDGYVFQLVLEHERQHQETLAYLLHMLDPAKKSRTANGDAQHDATANAASAVRDMLTIEAGELLLGAPWQMFVYDNELPAHTVSLPAFKIDRLLTTNEEYAHFIAEGGYQRREWWDEEGWQWRERENWTQPFYWTTQGTCSDGDERRGWSVRTMFAEGALKPEHPVAGVSWYEASAYARFAGKRLPTEAEWEKAASWNAAERRKNLFAWGDDAPTAAHGNFDLRQWDTTPVGAYPLGASSYGCLDMAGNVWEWTNDPFAGYENFTAYPYPEYSETWFDGDHRVLKGGSWATHPSILRTSFRNFFRRHFRIAFAGIRLAADA